jgi:hypothetical protein
VSADELARGRDAYENAAWTGAYACLTAADAASSLAADDLERLAIAAYMLGREDEWIAGLERAHHTY